MPSTSRVVIVAGSHCRREHIRRRADGTWQPKHAYDEEEARTRAESLQQKEKVRYQAYRCPTCNAWHVGRMPRQFPRHDRSAATMLFIELGERVCAHLAWENGGGKYDQSKFRRVLKRWAA